MFDNIGWAEIFLLLIVAVIIIGPERLPDVIKDVRAAIFAARKGIANARAELDGELGEEFNELRQPLSQAAEWGRMGPRKAISKVLFEGDENSLDDFDPRKILAGTGIDPTHETPKQAARRLRAQADALERAEENKKLSDGSQAHSKTPPSDGTASGGGDAKGNYGTGGGFSWTDIT